MDLKLFPNLEGVLDMIYNPTRTRLLMDADELGLRNCNGLWMLVSQAKEAAEWFLDKKLPDELIETVYRNMKLQTENLILIGMPGCGKSTLGKLLAESLGKNFVDADTELSEHFHMSIPDIFAREGESGFREKETFILEKLGKCSGLVIATGGGCVTKDRNYPLLHQNGNIFWIQRDLSLLPTNGRPLSQSNSPEAMYQIREPLYAAFADHVIDNNGDIPQVVDSIKRQWEDLK